MKKAKNMRQEIISNALYRLDESTRMIHSSLAVLDDREIWKKPNAASNSIGNLILHVCGNMHQYIIAALGNSPDVRDRESEFSATPGFTAKQLLVLLQNKVNDVKETIEACTTETLLLKKNVQGFTFSGIGIIVHVVEHYAYHTGQIAFWTKILKDQDLGFYDGIDLTLKNN